MKSDRLKTEGILEQVFSLPNSEQWRGSLTRRVLERIFFHCQDLDISHSVETGTGVSTILFSRLSQNHKVFSTIGKVNRIQMALDSPLTEKNTIEFIEGPTQKTLADYHFDRKIQVALIDGPHAYPFPDLEYFYLYPLLETNGILIVDDIHIPTIYNMFQFIKADEMFSLIEIVYRTAFFKRTNAPTLSPFGDGWNQQKYNEIAVKIEPTRRKFLQRFWNLGLKAAKLK